MNIYKIDEFKYVGHVSNLEETSTIRTRKGYIKSFIATHPYVVKKIWLADANDGQISFPFNGRKIKTIIFHDILRRKTFK